MQDLISRQDAIDVLGVFTQADALGHTPKQIVEALPSAQPEIEERTEEFAQNVPKEDLISRKAAIDALDEQITQCDKALGSFDISMKDEYAVKVERASLKAYRETLNVLPSAQPEPQWIPVSERFPDDLGDYLVSIKRIGWNMEEYVENDIAYWDDLEGFHKADEVLAWMPLPKPYRAERRTDD